MRPPASGSDGASPVNRDAQSQTLAIPYKEQPAQLREAAFPGEAAAKHSPPLQTMPSALSFPHSSFVIPIDAI